MEYNERKENMIKIENWFHLLNLKYSSLMKRIEKQLNICFSKHRYKKPQEEQRQIHRLCIHIFNILNPEHPSFQILRKIHL